MSQKDGGEDIFALVELPMKRKRGRPRKAEGSSSGEAENQHHSLHPSSSVPANQQRNTQQVDGKPPLMGAGVGNNEIPNEHGPIRGNSSDSMLGQVVHGVIDADIGDGYLISFRLGGINMKGVALKSSRVAPITAANDVAPLAKMFLRRDIPFPNINQHSQVASEAATASKCDSLSDFSSFRTQFMILYLILFFGCELYMNSSLSFLDDCLRIHLRTMVYYILSYSYLIL